MPPAKAKKKPAPKRKTPAKKAAKSRPKVASAKKPTRQPKAAPTAGDDAQRYEDHKLRVAERRRRMTAAGQEVGPLPEVKDPERRARGERSQAEFNRAYFPRRFKLPDSDSHRAADAVLEDCVDHGGVFALAMPRGSGKTTRAECAVLRAVLYGRRRYVVLVCATNRLAARRLKSILRELECNELLREDFPEVCYLFHRLDFAHQRTRGQRLDGLPTKIEITREGITLPTVPGKPASGAIIQIASMEGAIRGMNVPGPDGEQLRPDMVVIDDAQTRESAKSPIQTTDREAIVLDDVMGLAGPDVSLSAVMLCTVIFPGDLSSRFLDREKHPEWQGMRTKMLEVWPERLDLWDEYAERRRESFRSGDKGRRANEFYAERREDMDRGARVSWPERKKAGELSGLQSAMNLYYANPRGFKAEYQSDPEKDAGPALAKEFVPDLVAARLSGLPRGAVSREASRLVAFIDCGTRLLWYGVAALDNNFGGDVIDYGAWPRQNRSEFAASDPRPGLDDEAGGLPENVRANETTRVYAGLRALTDDVLGRAYYREGTGEALRVERCLIDSGWLSATIYQFCRESPHAGIIYPSKGIGRTPTARGVSEWKPRPGEASGWHWRLTMSETGRGRMVQFDPDAWKTFLHERLNTPMGGRGRLALFGREAAAHALLGQHCAAESSEPKTLRGSTFDKWTARVGADNHLLDVMVGLLLAGSVQGLTFSSSGVPTQAEAPAKPVDHRAEYERQRRAFEARRTGYR
jgi:hypothetical protein